MHHGTGINEERSFCMNLLLYALKYVNKCQISASILTPGTHFTSSSSRIGAGLKNVVAVQLPEKDYNGVQLAAEIKLRLTSAINVNHSTHIVVNTVEFLVDGKRQCGEVSVGFHDTAFFWRATRPSRIG